MAAPLVPDATTRARLLQILTEHLAAGAGAFLATPIRPSTATFPERWRPTRTGVALLLRRLAWHAGIARDIVIEGEPMGAPPTERKPATRVELVELRGGSLVFDLGFIGRDDVAGTLAHEIGVAFAAIHRADVGGPYRGIAVAPGDRDAAEPDADGDARSRADIEHHDDRAPAPDASDAANENATRRRSGARIAAIPIDERDLERGSVATVALGLGVLAANAAYQQYSTSGRTNGAYMPLEYDVLRSGHLAMSELAFLLAVQAVARAEDVPPAGLSPPQRDEVGAWISAIRASEADGLGSMTASIRAQLGIAPDVEPRAPRAIEAFADPGDDGDRPRNAFRWRTHRAGTGFLVGSVLGVALAVFVPVRGLVPLGTAAISVVGGFVAGRRIRVARCSRCLALVRDGSCCPRCNATLRGDIAHLNDRLAAEEALEDEVRETRPPVRTLDALEE